MKFFQTFWNVIKPEIMAIFDEFYVGTIDLGCLKPHKGWGSKVQSLH